MTELPSMELARLARILAERSVIRPRLVYISGGQLSVFKFSSGELHIDSHMSEFLSPVMKVNRDDSIGYYSSHKMIEWALERVRRHMILECLADV